MKYTNKFKLKVEDNQNERDTGSNYDYSNQPEIHNRSYQNFDPNKSQKKKHSISYFKNEHTSVSAFKQIERSQLRDLNEKNRFNKMNNLLGNIMSKHKEMKSKIQNLKRQKQLIQHAQNMVHTFEPKLNPNPRYPISTRMEDRNKSWDEARANHFTSIKQELVEREVKECTFSPHIVSKPRSNQYLRERDYRTNKINGNQRQNDETNMDKKFIVLPHREINVKKTPKKPKDYIDISSVKSMIRLEMSRINFNF